MWTTSVIISRVLRYCWNNLFKWDDWKLSVVANISCSCNGTMCNSQEIFRILTFFLHSISTLVCVSSWAVHIPQPCISRNFIPLKHSLSAASSPWAGPSLGCFWRSLKKTPLHTHPPSLHLPTCVDSSCNILSAFPQTKTQSNSISHKELSVVFCGQELRSTE